MTSVDKCVINRETVKNQKRAKRHNIKLITEKKTILECATLGSPVDDIFTVCKNVTVKIINMLR